MTPSIKTACLSFFAAAALTGCVGTTSYPTIEPLTFKPSSMTPAAAVEVDSLTPTFKWRHPDATEKDDLGIWQVGSDGQPGDPFAYKREISGGQYTLEKPLTPGEEYYWSVRKSGTSTWAKANYVGVSPLGAAWQNGVPFKIKAPIAGATPAAIAAPAEIHVSSVYESPPQSPNPPPPTANVVPASPAPTALPAQNAASASAYAVWEPWIGGVWSAQLPPEDDGIPKHMEARYSWFDNKEGVKIEGWGFKGSTQLYHSTGLIVWNPAEGRFKMQALISDGTVSQGVIHLEGDTFVNEFTQTRKDGTVLTARGLFKLVSANVGFSQLFQMSNGEWVKILDLRLERRLEASILP